MSYCRWSSDNFQCDIYAYASCYGGYEINVASGRYKGEIPKVPTVPKPDDKKGLEEWKEAENKRHKYLRNCGTEKIGLEYDGESFTCSNLQDFYEKMVMLKEVGYNVPEYSLERIQNEIEAKNN